MKYVMTKHGPVIFPECIRHDTFADLNPTSAGMVIVGTNGGSVSAFGMSLSLNLKAAEIQDTRSIKKMLGFKQSK